MSQSPIYNFSQDDVLFPIYCTQCRSHIPRDISDLGKGLCPDCISANVVAMQALALAKQQAQQQRQAQQQAAKAALHAVDTGLGRCPVCGSTNLSKDFDFHVNHSKSSNLSWSLAMVAAGIVSLVCCLPVAVVLIPLGIVLGVLSLLQSSGTRVYFRNCNSCGASRI